MEYIISNKFSKNSEFPFWCRVYFEGRELYSRDFKSLGEAKAGIPEDGKVFEYVD